MTKEMKPIVPVVYAVDEEFIPLLALSVQTIFDTRGTEHYYKIYVLNTSLKEEQTNYFNKFNTDNFEVNFINVNNEYEKFKKILCVRDNYSEAIYYRLLIPQLFTEYDRLIYIDADTVIVKDIAEFFNIDVEGYLLGVVREETVANTKVFQDYAEHYLNIDPKAYFNSGVLLMNLKEMRLQKLIEQFIKMTKKVIMRMAPDQDYLNVLCYKKVKYVNMGWNKSPLPAKDFNEEDLGLIHYNLTYKPWKFDNVLYEDIFWKMAKNSDFYSYFINIKNTVTEEDFKHAFANYQALVDISNECIANSANSPMKKENFLDEIRNDA